MESVAEPRDLRRGGILGYIIAGSFRLSFSWYVIVQFLNNHQHYMIRRGF